MDNNEKQREEIAQMRSHMNSIREESMQAKLLLSPREAAKVLGISERTLWTYTQAGEIPSLKIGRSVKYSVHALNEWIDRQSQKIA